MSKELIERLRRDKYDSLKNLAADRIEELEREVADALDCRSGTWPTALSMVLAERDQLREQVAMLRSVLKEIRDDFDCDEDSHRYGTTCRCCLAIKALAATEPS